MPIVRVHMETKEVPDKSPQVVVLPVLSAWMKMLADQAIQEMSHIKARKIANAEQKTKKFIKEQYNTDNLNMKICEKKSCKYQ